MDFLKWYKNKIESGSEEPPANLWSDIQNDLDIDTVYERLEKSLAKDRQKVWIWRASAAAGILLVLSLGYLFVYQENLTSPEQLVAQKSKDSEFNSDTIAKPSYSLIAEKDSTINAAVTEKNKFSVKTDNEADNLIARKFSEISEVKTFSPPDTTKLRTKAGENSLLDISLNTGDKQLIAMDFSLPEIQQNLVVPRITPEYLENPQRKLKFPQPANNNTNKIISKITLSAHGEIANTWLINSKTIEAFDPQNLTATRPAFKQNYGFSIAGALSERWEVIGQLSLAKQNEQHYLEYYQGQYVSNVINLKYTDIAFKARYRPFRKNPKHAFSTGIYMGFLDNAHQNIGGEASNITSDYANNDFGFIAGYQYFAPITDKISLAAGAFYRQGLKNIFAGNKVIGDNLNHSTNTSFNFTLSVGYTFSL